MDSLFQVDSLNQQFYQHNFHKESISKKTEIVADKMLFSLKTASKMAPASIDISIEATVDPQHDIVLKMTKKAEKSLLREVISAAALSFGLMCGYLAACKLFKGK